MEQGWVWDLDDFTVNQIGHPYQGNNYFNTGRANGLSFYESAAVTAFGSATWEYFGETNHASLNDFINTTLGGIALGEMFHRTAWLVRDTHATGRGRLWREIGATALDPVTGRESIHARGCLARDRQARGHGAVEPEPRLAQPACCGAARRTTRSRRPASHSWRSTRSTGIRTSGHSRTPYDAFAVRLRFGGGSALQRSPGARPPARTALRRTTSSSSASCRATTSRRTMPTPPDRKSSTPHFGFTQQPVVHDQVAGCWAGAG